MNSLTNEVLPSLPRRVAVFSVHTSPLNQPGFGDAGGMNVYVLNTALNLAQRGVEVDIFTRATSSRQLPVHRVADGVTVRHIEAGPFEGLRKEDLPSQMCPFTAGVLRNEAGQEPGYYDVIHAHYWLSGQVGWLARDRWKVPLVFTPHTLAAVKNLSLAQGDRPEPAARLIGEQQVLKESDLIIANTRSEAQQINRLYSHINQVDWVSPGTDLQVYRPGNKKSARCEFGLDDKEFIVGFVGRIQPLKAPDVLLRAMAPLLKPGKVRLMVVGGESGSGLDSPRSLADLAEELGVADAVSFFPPQPSSRLADVYRACDVLAVPSYSESFGLVAVEAQACGTPVLAADVGGLAMAVNHGKSGILLSGHQVELWTEHLRYLIENPRLVRQLASGARQHAKKFSWDATAAGLLNSYTKAMYAYRNSHRLIDCDALGWRRISCEG